MKIDLHPNYKKSYKKRVVNNLKLTLKTTERVKLFQQDPANPVLKDHQLQGEKSSLRAFWITGDIRIVYLPVSKDYAIFLDIGSHNQVY